MFNFNIFVNFLFVTYFQFHFVCVCGQNIGIVLKPLYLLLCCDLTSSLSWRIFHVYLRGMHSVLLLSGRAMFIWFSWFTILSFLLVIFCLIVLFITESTVLKSLTFIVELFLPSILLIFASHILGLTLLSMFYVLSVSYNNSCHSLSFLKLGQPPSYLVIICIECIFPFFYIQHICLLVHSECLVEFIYLGYFVV